MVFRNGSFHRFLASGDPQRHRGGSNYYEYRFLPHLFENSGHPAPEGSRNRWINMLPLMKGKAAETLHEDFYFIKGKKFKGVLTKDNIKYIDRHNYENGGYWMAKQGPFLFDLNYDPTESYNATVHFPEKAIKMREMLAAKRLDFEYNPRGWKQKERPSGFSSR